MSTINNKRIAKNTVMLYIRMIFSVCVNLYVSRVILQILGVEDFGIYNVVAGVVTMMGFLNNTMAGSTSRFITFEIGRNDICRLEKTFSSALYVHVIISVLIIILGETFGLWFVNTQLEIPENRYVVANYVYQFSLLSAIISFIQVPFNAEVIAHEKMDAYAYFEIFNVMMKLVIIYFVISSPFDKLISYAVSVPIINLLLLIIYIYYCRRNFLETRKLVKLSGDILLPMLKFSGWDLYGNGCVVARQQGMNILINRYFGVALNAASGVATQASSAVSMFVSSVIMALRPPIIKKYASGDLCALQKLLTMSIIICAVLIEIVCVPLYINIKPIMTLWLTEVPPYALQFCKWMILANAIGVLNSIFTIVIHATGKIKALSLIGGSLYLSTLIITYFAFMFSCGPVSTYVISMIVTCVILISNIIITKKLVKELSLLNLFKDIFRPLFCIVISVLFSLAFSSFIPDNIYGFILSFLFNTALLMFLLYILWMGPLFGWNPRKIFSEFVNH